MAIKRHKPEEIVAKLRQVPTTSARINRPDGPKARHELTINMDQLVGADQYRLAPPFRLISRLTVDGDRPRWPTNTSTWRSLATISSGL